MKTSTCFVMRFSAVFLVALTSFAQQVPAVRILLNTMTKPAGDLVDDAGKKLSVADLTVMYQNDKTMGTLSKLNPIENKYWQNKKYSAVDSAVHATMPQSETGVELDYKDDAETGERTLVAFGNRTLGTFTAMVKDKNNARFALTLGQQVHASLTKSALLRKIGVYQLSPKYYSRIKLKFKSAEEKQEFIEMAFCEKDVTTDCLSMNPFGTSTDPGEYLTPVGATDLYVNGCYLEKMNSETPSLFDGLVPVSPDEITYYANTRGYRGLLAPFVVGDLGESLNRVSANPSFIREGIAYVNYSGADYFRLTAHEDIKWHLKKINALTDQDWNDIVEASQYPPQYRLLVKSLLLDRAKNLTQTFFQKRETDGRSVVEIPKRKDMNDPSWILRGKVMKQYTPGYPQRFSHGDRSSPFESGDFLRFMRVAGVSSILELATNKLDSISSADIALGQKTKGFEVGPDGVRVIGHSTGLHLGLQYGISQLVTTGTFYGSQAPIQFVTNVSVTAGIGLMRFFNELNATSANIGANVGYSRDFTHVRPLNAIREALSEQIKHSNAKNVLKKLANLIGQTPTKKGAADGFVQFMNALRPGEVFLISDSIAGSAQANLNMGLDAIVGFNSGWFSPTLGFNVGGAKVLLRQIQITRTADGLQIFVRNQNSKVFSYGIDADYFINLMRVKAETTKTDLHTDAFVLNYSSDLVEQVDNGKLVDPDEKIKAKYQEQKQFGNKMGAMLKALISQSSTRRLYSDFRFNQFSIDHEIKTNQKKFKLLALRATSMSEQQLLTIKKPEIKMPDSGEVINTEIQIASSRRGELRGRDILGLGLDLIDGTSARYLKGFGPKLGLSAQNPTQVPLGQADWRIIKTESEITQNRDFALPTISMIQNVWGGWSLKRANLDQILESVRNRLVGTEFEGSQLIPDDALKNVEKIDFFRISANLTLLPSAVDLVKALVISPDTKEITLDKPLFFPRLFRKLFKSKDPARIEDKAMYQNLLELLGNGNAEQGRVAYLNACFANKEIDYQYTYLKGTKYECMEPWVEKLIKISRKYNSGSLIDQNKWMTEIIFTLEEKIPFANIINYLGKENYLFYVEIAGFRAGDEDALEGNYVSNVLGEPAKAHPYSNGLINLIADKTKIISTELNRTQADFQ